MSEPRIPAGKYRAIANGPGELTESKKGTPGAVFDMKITQGEMAGEVLEWTAWLSDAAKERSVASMKAMGWGGNLLDLSGCDQEVELVVKHETNDSGQTFARAAFVNPPRRTLDPTKAAALAAKFNAAKAADPFAD